MKNLLKKLYDVNHFKVNHLEFTLTSACTAMCSYCPQSKYIKAYKNLKSLSNDDGKPKYLTFDFYKTLLKNVDKHIENIYFTGYTEPMQNPEWFKIVCHTIESGYKVHFNTTLIGAKDIDIDNLLSLKIPLRIHLSNSRLKINRNYYDRIDKNYQGIVTFDYFTEEGAKLYSSPSINKTSGTINSRGDNLNLFEKKNITGPIFCMEYRQFSNVVLPTGDVSICCTDFGLKNIIGNLHKSTLKEIHESQALKLFIENMVYGYRRSICNSCHYAISFDEYNSLKHRLGRLKLILKSIIYK